MNINQLSSCFCTKNISACRDFYQKYLGAKITFDCGWYLNMDIGTQGVSIQFMAPQGDMPTYSGAGVTLNFAVDDVDAEHRRLMEAGLSEVMPLEDHPWGDRGFSVIDPIGNSVYIYSDREPSEEFKQYFKD
ncbi:VOC family protein [Teredinibacter sp. KSP-S5-2]|uniref:VOC family protein n=1 Tax=Teredinibacter sp. KSP-S5-2 TaxID=3034506 RepID=UPI0029340E99|nr:VOC family protein [Teredinibacter sp. KSP-S5-2]WNO09983.1 VOC family protein [Teredinibacter sp. KSP-S5-2]